MNLKNCLEKSIELNGRRVAFAIYGDPSLRIPVIYHHGFPGSKREAQLCAKTAAELGISVIAIDRPGLGASDYEAKRTLLNWPQLLESVANHLGLGALYLIGVSGGAPYALAGAQALGDRVLGTAIVSGMAEAAGNSDLLCEMATGNRILLKLAAQMPLLAHYSVAAIAAAWRYFPVLGFCWLHCFMPRSDRLMFKDVSTKHFLYAFLEDALRQGISGVLREFDILSSPWGFDVSAINSHVAIWHGMADSYVPPAMAHFLAARLPNNTSYFKEDAGHLMVIDYIGDILGLLCQKS